MPTAALRPCLEPGCPSFAERRGRCVVHATEFRRPQLRFQQGPVNYGRAWKTARAIYLREHPWCVDCLTENKQIPATELDHKIPHRGDVEQFWNREQWQGLCRSHHAAKTAREVGLGRAV